MKPFNTLNVPEQITKYLREEILHGRWGATLPGIKKLSLELGFSKNSVGIALKTLEKEGILKNTGLGRNKEIVTEKITEKSSKVQITSIAILCCNESGQADRHIVGIRHKLDQLGYFPFFAKKTLYQLKMNISSVAKLVRETPADAWIVSAGSQEVLEWFSKQEIPAYALSGRLRNVSIAGGGFNKAGVAAKLTRHLISIGHSRISCLFGAQFRFPIPGTTLTAILRELEAAGIPVGPFNLPDWEESKSGLLKVLDSLFSMTPPTAIIIDEAFVFHATYMYITNLGLKVPSNVSLVCTDPDLGFNWCVPPISHFDWNYHPLADHIINWLESASSESADLSQFFHDVTFSGKGTIATPMNLMKSL